MEAKNGPRRRGVVKLDVVHGDGDPPAAAMFATGTEPGEFVDPFQKDAAEEIAMMAQVLRPNEREIIHNRLPLTLTLSLKGRGDIVDVAEEIAVMAQVFRPDKRKIIHRDLHETEDAVATDERR